MYQYYNSDLRFLKRKNVSNAKRLGTQRFNPTLKSPDYLILKERRRLFSQWLNDLADTRLDILDIGGRIQPYRPLFGDNVESYIAIDPQFEGLVDIVSYGESLPIKGDCFDIVLCSQVLSYAKDPQKLISEIHRVLRKGGLLLLSAPAMFPRHHDERWRFLPDGLKELMSRFSDVEVEPEGGSIIGVLRTLNVCMNSYIHNYYLHRIFGNTMIPLTNLAGSALKKLHFGKDYFTANYSVRAIK